MLGNLGFMRFKEERAYSQAMAAREVPFVLENLVRELTFLNMGSRSKVISFAHALHVRRTLRLRRV
jgi:hypothetical protein